MTRDLIKVPILISFFFLFNLKHQKGFIKKDPVSIEKRKKGRGREVRNCQCLYVSPFSPGRFVFT